MMNDSERLSVSVMLKEFFREMRQWMLDCRQRERLEKAGSLSYDARDKQNLADANAIASQFFEPGVTFTTYSYGTPPTYDPDTDEILDIYEDRGRIIAEVQQTKVGFKHKLRYHLKRCDNGIRLTLNRQYFDERSNKYRKRDIFL